MHGSLHSVGVSCLCGFFIPQTLHTTSLPLSVCVCSLTQSVNERKGRKPTLKRHIHTISQKCHDRGVVCLLTRHLQLHQRTILTSEPCCCVLWQPTSQLACPSVQLFLAKKVVWEVILVLPTQVQTSSSVATSSQITSQLLSPTTSTFQPVILLSEEIAGTYHTQPVQHLKRTTQSSPINFPSKLTHSPCPKRFKRARTFSEAHKLHGSAVSTGHNLPFQRTEPQVIQQVLWRIQGKFFWSWMPWRDSETDFQLHVSGVD